MSIFGVWTSRIHASLHNVKDFYNSIKVKGVELTKALIKVCHYGSLVEIPNNADGKLDRDDDKLDWQSLVDFYIWRCWS